MKRSMKAMLLSVVVMLTLSGCGRSDFAIKKDVKPVIEKICAQNGITAVCKEITSIEKDPSSKDKYTAKALVSTGTAEEYVNVTITYSDDQVLVEIK